MHYLLALPGIAILRPGGEQCVQVTLGHLELGDLSADPALFMPQGGDHPRAPVWTSRPPSSRTHSSSRAITSLLDFHTDVTP